MKKIENIILLGGGNVATSIAISLKAAGYKILEVYSRSKETAQTLAEIINTKFTTDITNLSKNADLIVCSVPDDALGDMINKIGPQKAILVHTSGTTPMQIFENHFANYGVFYPLQTFTKSKPTSLKEVPICLEANSEENLETLISFSEHLSDIVHEVTSDKRKYLHVAAVFACNFPNYLFSIAKKIVDEQDLDFDIIKPLIKETASKVMSKPPKETQTGPAIRKDMKTMEKHKNLLKDHKDALEIYDLISRKIMKNEEL